MSWIIYKKGSLFDSPEGSYRAQACNTVGAWGAGIAAEFARRFPVSEKEYIKHCRIHTSDLVGESFITSEKVVCLFTSEFSGANKDEVADILLHTLWALKDFFGKLDLGVNEVHSNKFNSGIFNVPWKDTEIILKGVMALYGPPDLTWTVWDPELKT